MVCYIVLPLIIGTTVFVLLYFQTQRNGFINCSWPLVYWVMIFAFLFNLFALVSVRLYILIQRDDPRIITFRCKSRNI